LPKTHDDLLQEAYDNIREDRKRLKDAVDVLKDQASSDPTLLPMVAKLSVAVTEVMIRANSQMVDLAKLTRPPSPPDDNDDEFSGDEVESMMDEIKEEEEKN
jgi:hypothetical protein